MINPPLYSDVHLPTPLHEPKTWDVWRLGLYVTVWTAPVLEDVSGNGPFSGFRPTFLAPPLPPNFLARPAGPREPRRGSRDGLKLAPRSPLGGHHHVSMARDVAKMVFGTLWKPA